jgi:hypothetical protein
MKYSMCEEVKLIKGYIINGDSSEGQIELLQGSEFAHYRYELLKCVLQVINGVHGSNLCWEVNT